MITLSKISKEDLTQVELNRLYSEALPFISEEKKRLGEEVLKDFLIGSGLDGAPIIRYEVDGYLVGICSFIRFPYNGHNYLFHKHPLYGNDQNGSRAWWYSEEFQEKNSSFVKSLGFHGVIAPFNGNSPAAQAVANHFGSFDKYYHIPIIKQIEDLGLERGPQQEGLQLYVIDLVQGE